MAQNEEGRRLVDDIKAGSIGKVRAAIYCRISEDPSGRALGVGRQREDGMEIARRKGWIVVDEYVDNDVSASKHSRKARKQYRRLLEDIEAGRIDAVIIWMEDRLQRQVLELAEFLKVCEKAGVTRIVSVGGEFDLADPDQRTMLYIKAAMAEAEVEKLRSRVQRQRLQTAQSGQPHHGGRRPFGFPGRKRLEDGSSAPAATEEQVQAERKLIREAVDRVMAGEPINSVARDWKQREVRTPVGNVWSNQNIRQMLLNPALAGYRTHLGKLIKGSWEPVIPPDEWEALKAFLEDPSRRSRTLGRPAAHLLTGLVVCGICGHRMVKMYYRRGGGRRERIYTCKRRVAYGGCGRMYRRAEPIEELVTEALFLAVEGPEWDRQVQAAAKQAGNPAGKLYEQLARDRALLENLENHLADGLLSPEAYRRQRSRIEDRMDEARAQVARTQTGRTIAAVPTNLRQLWQELSIERQRAIVSTVFERIEVHPQGTKRNFTEEGRFAPTEVDPNSIKLVLRTGTSRGEQEPDPSTTAPATTEPG